MGHAQRKKKGKKRLNKHSLGLTKPLEYISRSRAIKKLQISMTDFRKLCILKGIYPQVPKNRKFSKTKIYYYKRDINCISREPVLAKYRDIKAYSKKKTKARSKFSTADLLSVKKSKPSINYDHLVKERYPTFGEALEDMDDPLTLICLFLSVPARAVKGFGPEKSEDLQRLYDEFLHLTAIKGWLRKSFISLKGFYFQVDIDGHSITWLKPHKFTQNLENKKIDFNSLVAFLEFYHTLLKFVVYKLYKDQKMDYPPKFEQNITLKSNNNLFHNFVFLLSKETPYDVLEYIIKALGGKIYIETNVFDKMDKIKPLLTHKISDRPLLSASKTKDNFENVQSQYVFDCLNFGKILPVGDYLPGNKCPDHVSPFKNFENLQIDQDAPKLENEDLNESEKKERLLDRIAAQKRTF